MGYVFCWLVLTGCAFWLHPALGIVWIVLNVLVLCYENARAKEYQDEVDRERERREAIARRRGRLAREKHERDVAKYGEMPEDYVGAIMWEIKRREGEGESDAA